MCSPGAGNFAGKQAGPLYWRWPQHASWRAEVASHRPCAAQAFNSRNIETFLGSCILTWATHEACNLVGGPFVERGRLGERLLSARGRICYDAHEEDFEETTSAYRLADIRSRRGLLGDGKRRIGSRRTAGARAVASESCAVFHRRSRRGRNLRHQLGDVLCPRPGKRLVGRTHTACPKTLRRRRLSRLRRSPMRWSRMRRGCPMRGSPMRCCPVRGTMRRRAMRRRASVRVHRVWLHLLRLLGTLLALLLHHGLGLRLLTATDGNRLPCVNRAGSCILTSTACEECNSVGVHSSSGVSLASLARSKRRICYGAHEEDYEETTSAYRLADIWSRGGFLGDGRRRIGIRRTAGAWTVASEGCALFHCGSR